MQDTFFWNECKKTIERDVSAEEYSTWIDPLELIENKDFYISLCAETESLSRA